METVSLSAALNATDDPLLVRQFAHLTVQPRPQSRTFFARSEIARVIRMTSLLSRRRVGKEARHL
jgi:hypothetical protein